MSQTLPRLVAQPFTTYFALLFHKETFICKCCRIDFSNYELLSEQEQDWNEIFSFFFLGDVMLELVTTVKSTSIVREWRYLKGEILRCRNIDVHLWNAIRNSHKLKNTYLIEYPILLIFVHQHLTTLSLQFSRSKIRSSKIGRVVNNHSRKEEEDK